MSATVYSGNTIYNLPSTPTAFAQANTNNKAAAGSGSAGIGASSRNNPDYIDGATIVYAAGSLGVVHNLAENNQLFFDAHDDDVTCITVSLDGMYAATGQMGKSPMVYIWPTDIPASQSKTPVNIIGKGFFDRGVCALSFSFDNKYIVCVSCDDGHALGIFDTSTGVKIVEAVGQHGLPPQIKWLEYCPAPQHCEYITKDHAGLCDVFASAGDHHLKMWSFRRPAGVVPGSLEYKAGSVGKVALRCM